MSNAFGKMWIILEPILFALIGSEVQVIQKQCGFTVKLARLVWIRRESMKYLQVDKIDPQSAGKGLAVLATALIFRMIGVVFAVSGGNLNKKEKIFMAFAWLPKAAVQVCLIRSGLWESV